MPLPGIRFTDDLQVRHLGPLPILVPFLQQTGLQAVIDAAVPAGDRKQLSHGQVVSALVLNRLMSPRSLYAVADWSRQVAIPEALQIAPSDLNDDCLLRTLDAIFPHLESIQGTLTWQVLERFQLDTAFVHWDLTSFFFEGSYDEEQQDVAAPLIKYGQPKKQDAGKWRKQMQVGIATTEDGGVPFWHRPFSGNAAEVSVVGDVMEELRRRIHRSTFTLVGDSKLISRHNMRKALQLGLSFLGPETRSDEIQQRYLALRATKAPACQLQRLAYGGDRRPRPQIYMGFETSFVLSDEETGTEHMLRRLFIVSAEERRAARRNRRRQLTKLMAEIAKIRRNLGRFSYKTNAQVRTRVKALLEKAKLQDGFAWDVQGEGSTMRLHFEKDPAAFGRIRQLDGVYTLVTNLGPEYTRDQLLERYKRQYLSERRFRDLKGPMQLRPVFLKKNQRIVALVFIVYVALLVYTLIERAARKHLAETGTTLPDPYTGRPLKQPTARRLLSAFEFYSVNLRQTEDDWEYLAPPFNPVQKQILATLGTDQPLDFLAGPPRKKPPRRRR